MVSYQLSLTLTSLMLSACAYQPVRAFKSESVQDYGCYKSFGGQQGYCDKRLGDIK